MWTSRACTAASRVGIRLSGGLIKATLFSAGHGKVPDLLIKITEFSSPASEAEHCS